MNKNTAVTESKTIVITGASAGIGEAAARELSKNNTVIIVGRSAATAVIAKELGVKYFRADFSDLASVRQLAKDLLSTCPRIDVLVNNAGGLMKSLTVTDDGFEQTFQVNYLAPFLLTYLLMDRLIESQAGIINTSSAAQNFSHLQLNDLQSARTPFTAYGNSKLLDLVHVKGLIRRYGDKGISAVAFHPGVVATSFAQTLKGPFSWLYNTSMKKILKTPAQGADTLVYLANNQPMWQQGGYYVNRKTTRPHRLASNSDAMKNIWDQTESLLGIGQ